MNKSSKSNEEECEKMSKRRAISSTSLEDRPPLRPAISPEGREAQLISLAYEVVEQRLRDGTESSQETTHFLKLGSTRNQLEIEKLKNETELLKAKQASLESTARMEKLYADAMNAMKTYSGKDDYDDVIVEDGGF